MSSYSEKLRDPRWLARREQIITKADHKCRECGETAEQTREKSKGGLQVHHVIYLRKREPWDYPDDLLVCLCGECHFARQGMEDDAIFEFGRLMGRMSQWQLYELAKRMRAKLLTDWTPDAVNASELVDPDEP